MTKPSGQIRILDMFALVCVGRVTLVNRPKLDDVLTRIEVARPELESLSPDDVNWFQRAREFAIDVVPWLDEVSSDLASHLDEEIYLQRDVLRRWSNSDGELSGIRFRASLDRNCDFEGATPNFIGEDVVNDAAKRFLVERHPQQRLVMNHACDYPGLFMGDNDDYWDLPETVDPSSCRIVPFLGPNDFPKAVPDGLEVRTCRERFDLHCRYPYLGLYLVLVLTEKDHTAVVRDFSLDFMSASDFVRS
jgi:hypothetical protein